MSYASVLLMSYLMVEFPPQLVFAADQGYASAQQRLDSLVNDVARDISQTPQRVDAVPWATAVLYMMEQLQNPPDAEYPARVLEVLTAAVYQLARQKIKKENV